MGTQRSVSDAEEWMGKVVDATKEDFDSLVSEGTVLVDVWGQECQPCLALMPAVERLAEERDDLDVVKLEAVKARRLCMSLKVMGLPAYLLYRDGEEVSRLSGAGVTESSLVAWLDENTKAATP